MRVVWEVTGRGMCVILQVAQLEGALAAASGMVEGTVERVKFKAANGYTVLRMTAVQATGQPPQQEQAPGGQMEPHNARPAKGACLHTIHATNHLPQHAPLPCCPGSWVYPACAAPATPAMQQCRTQILVCAVASKRQLLAG